MVHKLPPYKLKDLPAPVIRWLTKCYYNHVGIIGECLGELWVFEAVGKGFIPTHRLEDYLLTIGKEREVAILEPKKARPIAWIYSNISEIVGKNYDFKSLLWYQLFYQITGRWKGKTGKNATDTIYCSEAIAYIFPDIFPEPWLVAPNMIWRCDKFICIWESNNKDRVLFDKNNYL